MGFDIAVAWSLATPRTSLDYGNVGYYSDNGVVVIHQVAVWKVFEPHADLCALSGTAFRDKCISITVLPYQGCVY